MQETDSIARFEDAARAIVNQTGAGFAAVDGIEQDALRRREEPDGVDGLRGRDAVAVADVIGVGDDLGTLDRTDAELGARREGERVHVGFLRRLRRADAEPEQGKGRIDGV